MKLNIGCNDFKLPGFVNIDIDPAVEPDLVAPADSLPFENDSVDEIYAGHLLEHLSLSEMDLALKEWKRVLRPGGVLTVTVPDTAKGLLNYADGTITRDFLNQIVFGSCERDAQNHRQVFTPAILLQTLNHYFVNVKPLDTCPYLVAEVTWQTIATCQCEL